MSSIPKTSSKTTSKSAPRATTISKPTYHLKLIICGAGGVGKTAIVRRYVEDKFDRNYLLTIGMEPSNKVIPLKDRPNESINLLIYDVAGQERFQTLREVFFRGADGALLVFDLSNDTSLDILLDWYRQILERAGPIPTYLIGNKSDLVAAREVDEKTIQELVTKVKARKYFETSALSGQQIEGAFYELATAALDHARKGKPV